MSGSSSLLDPNDTFATLCESVGLDVRLRKALARLGYVRPTLVQSKCLPLAITSGRDLLVRARTGSGKTLAYCLPVLHKILARTGLGRTDGNSDDEGGIRAVILAPTRELCSQVHQTLVDLTYYCDEVVSIAVIAGAAKGKKDGKASLAQQEAMLRDRPDVVVSTPAGLLAHIRSGSLDLEKSVESLVVDEADLVLSFGYTGDITDIMKCLPKISQGFLMSATLSPELDSLKRVVLHSPAVLKLEEDNRRSSGKDGSLSQFYLSLPRKDKNLVLYVFLKLGLLKGKGLFFVNSTDQAYRLKLFFEQFHIRSVVLNGELPLRSRLNIIEQFNIGNFDYLIATDESTDAKRGKQDDSSEEESSEDEEGEKKRRKRSSKKKTKRKKRDTEYGVSRGLDFRGVSFVVNVDFPIAPDSYTHRVGRTARGGAKGVALSLVESESTEQAEMLALVQESQPRLPPVQSSSADDALQTRVTPASKESSGSSPANTTAEQRQPLPLDFDLNEIEGFRYRVEDVSRAVTKVAVKETRAAELRAEILNSERLHNHFEDNPADFKLLRHDRVATHISKVQDHLKHVPDYMLPRGMQAVQTNTRRKKRRVRKYQSQGSAGHGKKDPLKSYDGEVTLDGVADGGRDDEEQKTSSDSAFFDVDGGEDGSKKRWMAGDGNLGEAFSEASEGGRSTSGRNRWKQKHRKGKYSAKYHKKR
mmetsp:Transcript_32521/g.59793  ORF Transcript_32521/g.59793 Transcript_32521/m.59793 type:complete len:701 (-) Transcript_32521:44-2146(-)